eukprot:scaffold20651_cov39-Prasinocladus_malaysianus.AAC.2
MERKELKCNAIQFNGLCINDAVRWTNEMKCAAMQCNGTAMNGMKRRGMQLYVAIGSRLTQWNECNGVKWN